MRITQAATLSALTAAILAVAVFSDANAQDGFVNGAPIYKSDVDQRQKQLDDQRAERRKSYGTVTYPKYMDGGDKPEIAPQEPPIVYLDNPEPPGTIIVDTNGRKLYYVLPGSRAYAYPISVGREGFEWTGTEKISRVASWPSWTPPAEMRQRQPGLPITVSGGLINPLGAKALYLGNTIYRIHGTNNERSIGRASSSGCFRMSNEHVVHLAKMARIGTTVRVVSTYTNGVNTSMPLSSLLSGIGFGSDDEPAPAPKTNPKAKKKK
jgi:lipoprotein-anchoring transpeptidase ErfK/SrfK